LGDMTVCFNNVIDQHINYLYNRLSDDNTLVKKNALMVLTHLILNGMIKAKDQLIEMHKCLGDDDQRISDLAKLFFSELETKDNAVYKHNYINIPIMTSNDPNIPFRHSISSVPLHHQIDTDASSRETTRPRPQSYQTTSSSDPSDVSFRHDIASIPSGYHQQQQQQAEHPSPSPALPGATRLSRSSASRGSRSSNNPP
ncbi:11818_t:CDS:2, partial [Entrophospora sp. SA101]